MATIASLPISFNPNDFTSDFLINAVGNYNSLPSTERSLYSDDLSFEPLKLDTESFDSTMANPGFVNYITGRKAFGPTVYVDEASEKRAQQGSVPSAEELAKRLRERTPMFREGESIPSYDPASGLTAQQFWSQYPSLMYAGEGLKGTIFGLSNQEQTEINQSPNVRPSYQQPRRETTFSPGGHQRGQGVSISTTGADFKGPSYTGDFSDILSVIASKTAEGDFRPESVQDEVNRRARKKDREAIPELDDAPAPLPLSKVTPTSHHAGLDSGLMPTSIAGPLAANVEGKRGKGLGPDGGGGGSGAGGATCFIAGTLVMMADGTKKKIEDIKIGETLLGQDNSHNKVIKYDHPMLDKRQLISINNSKPFMTPEHPIYTRDGWKSYRLSDTIRENPAMKDEMSGQFNVGDEILNVDGVWIEIKTIEVFDNEPQQQLYNFILDGSNTYYADGFLVHNKGIICTELERQGLVSTEIWKDMVGAGGLFPQVVLDGYHLWAQPVVRRMKKSDSFSRKIETLAKPVVYQIAAFNGGCGKWSVTGLSMLAVGMPICAILGAAMLPFKQKNSNLVLGDKQW